jgi:ATP-dependent DNA helicase DinG
MAEVTLTIPPEIRQFLAETIARAGGNEVYFLARLAWDRPKAARVEEVDVLARGNATSVPAIIHRAEEWDLAIHNHPSGVLLPSEEDTLVAGELGNREVGFAIIDNRAERHYLVVAPFEREKVVPLDPAEVEAFFAPGGPLGRGLPDYEARPGQMAMAREVTEALNEDRVSAIEAGTGVGKSFAYLVPAILWAVRNKKRVIVSTNTINLQEQLIGKDLPFLHRALEVKFRSALIKGRGNYACKRKLSELEAPGIPLLAESGGEERQLRALVEWSKQAVEGSLSELGATPPEAVWERAMSETDKSLKVNCRFYSECFYYRAKRAAFASDIVVVNHHLFFADLAVRRVTGNYDWNLVIPGYRRVIFDEAHHLEDVASKHLGVQLSQVGMRTRFGRLVSRKDSKKGTLPYLAHRLRKEGAPVAAEALEQGLLATVTSAGARVEDELEFLAFQVEEEARRPAREGRGADEADGRESQVRIGSDPRQEEFRREIERGLRAVREELSLVLRQAERVIEVLESSGLDDDKKAAMLLDLTSLTKRLAKVCGDIEFFLDFKNTTHVRWAEVRGRPGNPERRGVVFASAPIRVAADLKAAVYDPLSTVVMTSATLSVEGNVSFLGDRLGFDQVREGRFRFREQPSPFDFERQVLTLVPEDFPDPGAAGYEERVAETVLSILLITRGRAFILFTSYWLLRRIHERLGGRLAAEGIRALRQGETGRSELLRQFRSGPPHALFGTDSFWEGVDVKGEALECVVITRLPFRVPSEPIQVARMEELEARGVNPFGAFTVPQAVLKFKQGFGRLIRSATDRGVVVVLDRRIVTKHYGRAFLRSLPPTRFIRAATPEVLRSLAEFFHAKAPESTITGGEERLEAPDAR